jgi:hypothetical protein
MEMRPRSVIAASAFGGIAVLGHRPPGPAFPPPSDADLRSMLADLGRRVEHMEAQLNRRDEALDR